MSDLPAYRTLAEAGRLIRARQAGPPGSRISTAPRPPSHPLQPIRLSTRMRSTHVLHAVPNTLAIAQANGARGRDHARLCGAPRN